MKRFKLSFSQIKDAFAGFEGMDLHELDKSPRMKSFLVQLYENNKLYLTAKGDKKEARLELTRAVADLFHLELSERERDLVSEVLISLIRQAEKDLRVALSEKLAKIDNAPLSLILHLANDDITIAAPVLRHSNVLNDLDLLYIIKSQGPDYWQTIAGRAELRDEIINALVDTNDVGTAIVLTQNERIVLTRHAIKILGDMALENDEIAKPLIKRKELPRSLVKTIYEHAGEEMKTYIRAFYKTPQADIEKAIDDMVIEFAEVREERPEFWPSDATIEIAQKKKDLNLLTNELMMGTLKEGDIAGFIGMFSVYTGLGVDKIHGFLRQACPKGFVIACRAYGIQKSDFSRIFLMTNRMRAKDRMVNHKIMIELLEYFDKVRPETAARIVRAAK